MMDAEPATVRLRKRLGRPPRCGPKMRSLDIICPHGGLRFWYVEGQIATEGEPYLITLSLSRMAASRAWCEHLDALGERCAMPLPAGAADGR